MFIATIRNPAQTAKQKDSPFQHSGSGIHIASTHHCPEGSNYKPYEAMRTFPLLTYFAKSLQEYFLYLIRGTG